MPTPRPIALSASDHERLCLFLQRGKANVRTFKRAQVLLKLSAGGSGAQIADAYGVSQNTVSNVRTRFLRGGLDAVLSDHRQERRRQALTGAQQAPLIAIACSDVPDGHDHWTLRLLAGKAVELGFVEHIALEPIRSLLQRTSSNPGSIGNGVFPA
ncbi:MAG TPA: helix-turn-helix domain-containing protein [Ktedonobacterales bacterium]